MKFKSAKAKGIRAVNELKQLIHRIFPDLTDADVVRTPCGARGEDLTFSAKARELLPISVEVKNQEKFNVWRAIEQAKRNCKEWHPVVVFRRNRCSTLYAVIEATTLLTILRAASGSASGSQAREREEVADA